MNTIVRLITLALTTAIAGCISPALQPDMRPTIGESPAYKDGYSDGCHSGYVSGGSLFNRFRHDAARMQQDEDYRLGWNLAYQRCKDQFRQMCIDGGIFSRASVYCSDVREQGLDKAP